MALNRVAMPRASVRMVAPVQVCQATEAVRAGGTAGRGGLIARDSDFQLQLTSFESGLQVAKALRRGACQGEPSLPESYLRSQGEPECIEVVFVAA